MERCPWAESSDRMRRYHDEEWGVPTRDDRELFELLLLEGFQAGLSWSTILDKRERFRAAFDGFEPERIATYDEDRIAALLADPGIVRNRLKLRGAVRNARAYLDLVAREGAFAPWVWAFVGGRTLARDTPPTAAQVPARSAESEALSRALKAAGFTFVGPTITYAFMQSAGLVDDHVAGCFRARSR
jgi:DNA-3-methyladenine glycosylase I